MQEYLIRMEPDLDALCHLFGLPSGLWEGEAPRFTYTACEEARAYRCTVTDGSDSLTAVCDIPSNADERLEQLHRKRAARRLVKQTAYDFLKQVTGFHPVWGSSTGVRPTHLLYEALGEGLAMDDAVRAVMDRFDLTEEKAHLLRQIVTTQQKLKPSDLNDVDVYIGIPFCTTRCTYCSFSSGEIGNGRRVEPYLDALHREMRFCAGLLRNSGKRLRALYIGGGTPTSLNEAQFRALLDETMRCFPGAEEYTVEAGRPDTITPDKLRAIREHDIGRISINPQTMNDRTLAVIGRSHTAAQVEEAYAMARDIGIRHINMDVIAGLPGETTNDFAVTMDAALRLKPESLTVHTLAIKRSSRLALEQYPLPDDGEAGEMVRMGGETAAKLGLEPYYLYRQKYMAGNQENVGYALPGHACRYNVDIMEETTHILALGAGGISKRVFEEEGKIQRAPNVSNIDEYIRRVDEMMQRKQELFV